MSVSPMSPAPHPSSYWTETSALEPEGIKPLGGDRTVDTAVIGGGYTGLAAAYRLAMIHSIETFVLEAHQIGWGASGRNGGFVGISVGRVGLQERVTKW